MPYEYTYPGEPWRLPPPLDPHRHPWLLWAVTMAVAFGTAFATVSPVKPSDSVLLPGG